MTNIRNLHLGLQRKRGGPLSGVTPDGVIFDGFEEPPVVVIIDDEIIITGKVKPGYYGKFVYPVEALQSNFQYKVNFTADLSGLELGGAKAGFGFGFKQGNKFMLALLQGDAGATRAAIVRGSPPNGWNRPTGHAVTDLGEPTNGNQHGGDIRLVTAEDGLSIDFETSGDDQGSWDAEADDASISPFADVAEAAQAGFAGYFHSTDGGEFSVSLTWVSEAAQQLTLDGVAGVTGAYSFSRALLSSFGAGTLYTTNTSKIDALNDQSGAARNFLQTTAARRPSPGTAGPNAVACGVFNSTDATFLTTAAGVNMAAFLTASAGWMAVSCRPTTINTNNATVYTNEGLICDTGQFLGLFFKTGDAVHVYNWDGSVDTASTPVSENTPYVIEWRHEGDTLYCRVNGGTEVSVASGNTTTLTGLLRIGADSVGGAGGSMDGAIFEVVVCNQVPNLATRDAIVADMMAHIGAT